jgi:tetratricopeptide (TPR) repeat protein
MKAERRHELQQNSLAGFLENLPIMLRLYADRILLVVVLVLMVIVLIRWRMNVNATHSQQLANDLATAKESVKQLATINPDGPAEQTVTIRGEKIDEVNQAIDNIANNASSVDERIQAQAMVTKGDLNWTLANSPPLKGAATQPMLQLPKSSDDYLNTAADAYQQVLKSYPNQKDAVLSAEFGLAAIEENRHNWDEATKYYEQIKSSDVEPMYKDLADARLKVLPDIKTPLLIGTLTTKPAEMTPLVFAPATQPATTQSTK